MVVSRFEVVKNWKSFFFRWFVLLLLLCLECTPRPWRIAILSLVLEHFLKAWWLTICLAKERETFGLYRNGSPYFFPSFYIQTQNDDEKKKREAANEWRKRAISREIYNVDRYIYRQYAAIDAPYIFRFLLLHFYFPLFVLSLSYYLDFSLNFLLFFFISSQVSISFSLRSFINHISLRITLALSLSSLWFKIAVHLFGWTVFIQR